MLKEIFGKIENGERISKDEALILYQRASWLDLAKRAHEIRLAKNGLKYASYTMFRVVNYTSICNIGCNFCSFQRDPNHKTAYTLNKEQIFEKIDHAMSVGADQVFFQGGVNPDLPLDYYIEMLSSIKERYGNIHIRGFSPVELFHMAEDYELSWDELLEKLKKAGLNSVPGAGAEILVERVREILSPNKCTTAQWADLMKACHRKGLKGSANIVIGSEEEDDEIIEHLDVVRQIQDETGGFETFIPWTFQQQTKNFKVRKVPHHEFLKLLSLCRIYFDNIDHIEISIMVLGQDIGKIALQVGADDINSPVIEENVLKSFGLKSENQAQKLIQEAGFEHRRRDFNYNYL